MLARARTFTIVGVNALEVQVEVDVRRGLPTFSLVGLPDAAVRESRERVRAALANSGFKFPQQRITANLAPADLRKAGPGIDLAIAAALLAAEGQVPAAALERIALAGELALDGSIRPIAGALVMADAAGRCGAEAIAVPAANGAEAALAGGPRVVPLKRLEQLGSIGGAEEPPPPTPIDLDDLSGLNGGGPDLRDLRGQPALRRALKVAAAGGHSLLILGPPGAGKSLAARRLPSLLPPLRREEAIEVMRIASVCGRSPVTERPVRPFRAPHHTISTSGLVGGGLPPRPGETTLAHRGVLFLDELAEFSRPALEALRQPLEDGRITLVRAGYAIQLPCQFQLVAAANPCPCGRGEESDECECSPVAVRRYGAKLSGALSDRIDISLRVEQPSAAALAAAPGEPSAAVRERACAARARQEHRLGLGRCNAVMAPGEAGRHARLDAEAEALLSQGHERLGLSGRGFERVVRVARTIADLGESERVRGEHVAEALTLRARRQSP